MYNVLCTVYTGKLFGQGVNSYTEEAIYNFKKIDKWTIRALLNK
jgi:hypothetical protein